MHTPGKRQPSLNLTFDTQPPRGLGMPDGPLQLAGKHPVRLALDALLIGLQRILMRLRGTLDKTRQWAMSMAGTCSSCKTTIATVASALAALSLRNGPCE